MGPHYMTQQFKLVIPVFIVGFLAWRCILVSVFACLY